MGEWIQPPAPLSLWGGGAEGDRGPADYHRRPFWRLLPPCIEDQPHPSSVPTVARLNCAVNDGERHRYEEAGVAGTGEAGADRGRSRH
jgi:hypothetical protein